MATLEPVEKELEVERDGIAHCIKLRFAHDATRPADADHVIYAWFWGRDAWLDVGVSVLGHGDDSQDVAVLHAIEASEDYRASLNVR